MNARRYFREVQVFHAFQAVDLGQVGIHVHFPGVPPLPGKDHRYIAGNGIAVEFDERLLQPVHAFIQDDPAFFHDQDPLGDALDLEGRLRRHDHGQLLFLDEAKDGGQEDFAQVGIEEMDHVVDEKIVGRRAPGRAIRKKMVFSPLDMAAIFCPGGKVSPLMAQAAEPP